MRFYCSKLKNFRVYIVSIIFWFYDWYVIYIVYRKLGVVTKLIYIVFKISKIKKRFRLLILLEKLINSSFIMIKRYIFYFLIIGFW